ncbi:acetoacetate--CoA ligase [Gordonia jinghuaiqii]|uniref:Acetoacetate--CoA ligase n=2 Tax=Gordonia jinghuaiqii TaxID=2758710 RepID=A0A7D7LUZ0_9ACTN|nr:acetoacetate--CoA ligase [Gordonia jinghuaiqii]QMT04085.1 acetoacetate--CoA ligase [Gordonia jinghuaiqii]
MLWRPATVAESNNMQTFRHWLGTERQVDIPDYPALWRWSVSDLAGFWEAIADYFDVGFHERPTTVIAGSQMPEVTWFEGATLNYAEHALRFGDGKRDSDLAVIFEGESGFSQSITYGELRHQVAAVRAALVELGVRAGDRVVALAPNIPQTLVAFLSAASIGAIWSSCSPDFGATAVIDRFSQVTPTVLFAVDGYPYNGKKFDIRSTVVQIRDELPTLKTTVLIDYLGIEATSPRVDTSTAAHPNVGWDEMIERHRGATVQYESVPFDHPLWILYSSGTTGLPKAIVHGHGGMLLEHLKAIGLHSDLGPQDRFFWFTTTGWMVWNFLVGGLLVGSTVVLYDGSPTYESLSVLWRLAERHRVKYFGTSPLFIDTCAREGLIPGEQYDLPALRTIGVTGSPLTEPGFRWIHRSVGPDIQVASVSGGTDVCTALVGASPDVPVWVGEISCATLGAAVEIFDDSGNQLVGEVGELVVTKPMPAMPVCFWNDPDRSRLREAYFDTFPGVWRHGDSAMVTERGTFVVSGRSDSTLNRGGIRMGTAEFYRVVESFPGVLDSLVIDTSSGGTRGDLLCFVVLADGRTLDDLTPSLATLLRRELSPRHVPDQFIEIAEVPRTLSGKKVEVPIKKILAGADPNTVISRDALRNPNALRGFVPRHALNTKS